MGTSELPHQKKIMNRSAPAATIVPVLIYEDVDKAIEWLCRAFGLSERLRASGAGGRITHAQLSIGNGDLMIGASGAEFRPPHGEEVSQYVLVHVGSCRPPLDVFGVDRRYCSGAMGAKRVQFR